MSTKLFILMFMEKLNLGLYILAKFCLFGQLLGIASYLGAVSVVEILSKWL